jgi:predicted transcriptional regulator
MDIVYELGDATVAEVLDRIPDPPSYSAIRALLRILEDKGHVQHRQDGARYVYSATVPRERARTTALDRVVQTFFGGSAESAMAALLDLRGDDLEPDALQRIAEQIERARRQGR